MTTTNTSAPWDEPVASEEVEVSAFSEFSEYGVPEMDANESRVDEDAVPPEKEPLIDEIASEYVGFWNLLVSKTNWEKGKVIHSWRAKLMEAGLPRRIYSDEAIAQRIGNVSPQHVGRLRRVYERFGEAETLPNLYWSHYQAALDWDDAETWLKKASDEKVSVAQMRVARWEKDGSKLKHKPKEEDIVLEEKDADVYPFNDSNSDPRAEVVGPSGATLSADDDDDDDAKKKPKKKKNRQTDPLGEYGEDTEPWENSAETFGTPEVLDALNKLEELPEDLAVAFETLKIAILSHKMAGWDDVQPKLIAAYLSEFKRLLVSEEK